VDPIQDPTELLVERVPVAGRRPLMSAAVAGVVVIVFLGLAIAKPWSLPGDDDLALARSAAASAVASVSTRAPAIAVATPRPSRAPSRPVALPTNLPSEPLGAELQAATVRRDAWGISAVVVPAGMQRFDVGGPGLAERWMPIDVAHGAAWNLALEGTAESWGDAVLALGATVPEAASPLSVRFWRLDDTDDPREISAVAVPEAGDGTQLWLPDPANSTAIGTWPAGTYRIDVTVGSRVVRLVMIVRGDLSTQ
jgi:hypothetical protein